MDRVSNTDRLVLLLRERLLERAKAGGLRPAGGVRRQESEPAATGLDNLQALVAVEGIDDRQLGRGLIQGILVDHFGPGMLNEAKFQQIVDQVYQSLETDADAARLLSCMVGELRALET